MSMLLILSNVIAIVTAWSKSGASTQPGFRCLNVTQYDFIPSPFPPSPRRCNLGPSVCPLVIYQFRTTNSPVIPRIHLDSPHRPLHNTADIYRLDTLG